jgi:hypothetical protein
MIVFYDPEFGCVMLYYYDAHMRVRFRNLTWLRDDADIGSLSYKTISGVRELCHSTGMEILEDDGAP